MVAVVLVAVVPENEVLMLAYPVSTPGRRCTAGRYCVLPAGGGADPFQVGAPDGTHIDIHIFPAQHRTGGRDHGDGVGACDRFRGSGYRRLPVVGGVLYPPVPLPVVAAVLIISSVKRDPSRNSWWCYIPGRKDVGIDDIYRWCRRG